MKILKRILQIFLILVGTLIIVILLILAVDAQRTGYLKVSKHESAQANSWVITNVHVIPMTRDTILANKMVFIRDGKIAEIGDEINITGVDRIDGNGGYLMPGLIDMHVHLWDRYELGLYLASGVTAIRNVWGMPMHLRIKEKINADKLLAPSFYTTGPKLTGPEFIGDDNLQLFSAEEGREKVIEYKDRGYDFIKTYYGLTPEIFDAIMEQAKASGMEIVAHPSQKVPYAYHFNPPIVSIEHAEDIVQQPLEYQLDTVQLDQLVTEFAAHPNTSFCPTLIAYYNIYNMLTDDHILDSEPVKYMNASIRKLDSKAQFDRWQSSKSQDSGIIQWTRDQHAFHLLAIKKLHDAGVNIICGTDAGIGVTVPGASIRQEMAFYREAGLSNYEVLETATVNAAKVHTIMHNLGTIESGKVANLLLLEANPLEDLSALDEPAFVFVRGRILNRNILDEFKANACDRHNLIATAIRYVENLWVEK